MLGRSQVFDLNYPHLSSETLRLKAIFGVHSIRRDALARYNTIRQQPYWKEELHVGMHLPKSETPNSKATMLSSREFCPAKVAVTGDGAGVELFESASTT